MGDQPYEAPVRLLVHPLSSRLHRSEFPLFPTGKIKDQGSPQCWSRFLVKRKRMAGLQENEGEEQKWREGWEHGLTLCVLVLCRENPL